MNADQGYRQVCELCLSITGGNKKDCDKCSNKNYCPKKIIVQTKLF